MPFITFFLFIFNLVIGSAYAQNADWMKDYSQYIKNKPLKDIFIPGTHDSAAYNLENTFGRGQDFPHKLNILKIIGIGYVVTKVAKNWTKAQNRTIYQQLEDGNRFLDLRVVYRKSKKKFYTIHELYGPKLDFVLDQINEFCEKHPKEIVIIQVGDLRYLSPHGQGSEKELIQKLKDNFKDKLVPKSLGPNATIEELWKHNKQVVLIYDHSNVVKGDDLIWARDAYLESYWTDTQNTMELKKKLDKHLEKRSTFYGNKLYVVQSQLTANTQMIKKSLNIFSKSPKSLLTLAKQVRPELKEWLDEWKNKKPNIIITDFADSKSAELILKLNKSNSKEYYRTRTMNTR